ncbi:MAG: hypothetical protein ACFFD4_13435 [Candidatus Odinarchaeota archaeon]
MILIFLHDGEFIFEEALVDIGFKKGSLFHSAWISSENRLVETYPISFKGNNWFLENGSEEDYNAAITGTKDIIELEIDHNGVKLKYDIINDVMKGIGDKSGLQMQAVVVKNAHDNYNRWLVSNRLGYAHRGYRDNYEDLWAEFGPLRFWLHFWTSLISKIGSIDEKVQFFKNFHFLPLDIIKQAGEPAYEY